MEPSVGGGDSHQAVHGKQTCVIKGDEALRVVHVQELMKLEEELACLRKDHEAEMYRLKKEHEGKLFRFKQSAAKAEAEQAERLLDMTKHVLRTPPSSQQDQLD